MELLPGIDLGELLSRNACRPFDAARDGLGASNLIIVVGIKAVDVAQAIGGLGLGNVVSAQCYLEDPQNYAQFNEIYKEFFPQRRPARTTIGVPNPSAPARAVRPIRWT